MMLQDFVEQYDREMRNKDVAERERRTLSQAIAVVQRAKALQQELHIGPELARYLARQEQRDLHRATVIHPAYGVVVGAGE